MYRHIFQRYGQLGLDTSAGRLVVSMISTHARLSQLSFSFSYHKHAATCPSIDFVKSSLHAVVEKRWCPYGNCSLHDDLNRFPINQHLLAPQRPRSSRSQADSLKLRSFHSPLPLQPCLQAATAPQANQSNPWALQPFQTELRCGMTARTPWLTSALFMG